MSELPKCPQCGVDVHETWDWCQACGYDPDGLRTAPADAAPPAAARPPEARTRRRARGRTSDPVSPSGAPTTAPVAPRSAGPVATASPAPPPAPPPPPPPPPPSGAAGVEAGTIDLRDGAARPTEPAARPATAPVPGSRPTTGVPTRRLIAGVAIVIVVLAVAVVALTGRRSSDPEAADNANAGVESTGTASPTSSQAPSAGDPSGGGSGTLLDHSMAEKVVADLWGRRLQAVNDGDTAALATIETGAARDWDVACAESCGHRSLTAGPEPPALVAPPQGGYPLHFIAQQFGQCSCTDDAGQVHDQPLTNLVVYTQPSVDEPWVIVLVTELDGHVTPLGQPGQASFGDEVPQQLPLDLHTLPDQMAVLWDTWQRTGSPPADTPFPVQGPIADVGATIEQGRQQAQADDVTVTAAYRSGAADDGFFPAVLGPDDVIACTSVRWHQSTDPAGGRPLTQPEDQTRYGRLLAPGSYQRVEEDGLRQSCFRLIVHCSCVDAYGQEGGPTAVAGS